MQLAHTLPDGTPLTLHISRRTKSSIIIRARSRSSLAISIPQRLPLAQLQQWLHSNPDALQRSLAKAPSSDEHSLPARVWFRGTPHHLRFDRNLQRAELDSPLIALPFVDAAHGKQLISRLLKQHAAQELLPRLQQHSERLQMHPAATALTSAKGFWGVCRSRSGIRLNWRLIGAPDFVVDYVCVHELCHLREANHSPRFWALVEQHTPHTAAAKRWLKQYGSELFALG